MNHNGKRTYEKLKSIFYNIKISNFRFTGSDYANYQTRPGISAPNVALSYIKPSEAIDVLILKIGEFENKNSNDFIISY